ncbi:YbaN family protein [Pseudalkalibacillus sp. A8]|uniref:YbaN family protein n=1 Tax=Pseudalkalibacillus sp. A8 TaxID=3382641 RepID=UPI0038B51384
MITLKKIKTILFFLLGTLALLIGLAGTILPVLPGGPFYLIAAFCFTKSSERVDNWFKSTSLYTKYVEAFLLKKGMSRKEKIKINLIADLFILTSILYVDILLIKILMIVLAFYKHYYFIYRIKTIPAKNTAQKTS